MLGIGLKPIAEQVSGGHLLPPVQKLVATTILLLREQNGNRVLYRSQEKTIPKSVATYIPVSDNLGFA